MNAMYEMSIPMFNRFLKNLDVILDKAAAQCDAKKIDHNAILHARLFPDMFHFIKQVQVTCDFAKGGAARLAGVDVPKYDETEISFADLKARIKKTQEFLATFKPEQFAGAETRMITVPLKEPVTVTGLSYLQVMALPNFFFHMSTAYAILRSNGIEVGKTDFIGPRSNPQ